MKFDPTKPVQTRDGRPARVLATDVVSKRYPIAAAVLCEDGLEELFTYTTEGIFGLGRVDDDLVNIPEKRVFERWINVYPRGQEDVCKNRAVAEDCVGPDCIARLYIKQEYIEGDGL